MYCTVCLSPSIGYPYFVIYTEYITYQGERLKNKFYHDDTCNAVLLLLFSCILVHIVIMILSVILLLSLVVVVMI